MSIPRLIVFSDLDGTLLDHETYSFEAARPALDRLRDAGHLLVLASSKTAAEIAPLRAQMGFSHCPAIVENGSGQLAPGDDGQGADDDEHRHIREVLDGLPPQLRAHFSGFSDWSVAEIGARTGLPEQDAERAGMRRFSEPGQWSGSQEQLAQFVQLLSDAGIAAVMGGRYLTLSHGKTKATQMDEIIAGHALPDQPLFSIALGDAPNDIPMLEKADRGVIIINPAHSGLAQLPGESEGRIIRSRKPGPAGWNEEMLRLMDAHR